jgi:hypothetical protein
MTVDLSVVIDSGYLPSENHSLCRKHCEKKKLTHLVSAKQFMFILPAEFKKGVFEARIGSTYLTAGRNAENKSNRGIQFGPSNSR